MAILSPNRLCTDQSNTKRAIKPILMASAATVLMAQLATPAHAQAVIEITDNTPVSNPGGATVNVAAGVTQTVNDGDNIELENDTNDGTIINVAGTLINNDATDEDVVIFIDNAEDDVVINIASTGILRGVNGVIFQEGDGLTLTNNGLIEGTGNADEGVLYFDRDTDSALNTVTNNGTITNLGGGATIGVDSLLDTVTLTLVNTGTISNLNGIDDGDSDAINFNGDPGNTGGQDRGCLEGATVLCQFQIDVTNSGTISAARDNSSNAAIRVESDAVINGMITNQATGAITGAYNGININGAHAAHNLTINNSGTITGTSRNGVEITGAGVTLNNLAGGVITGGDAGLLVASTVIDVDIGPTTTTGVAVAAVNNSFVNAGTIRGTRASVDLSDAGEAVTFEQRGGALTGDFLGTTGFTDFLNFTTSNFTLTHNILQSVNVNVASGVILDVGGARTINGNLVSNGTIAFLLGTDSLAVSGDVTLNSGSVISVADTNGVVTAAGQQFTLITSGGTLTNGGTLQTTAVDNSFLLNFVVVAATPNSVVVEAQLASAPPPPLDYRKFPGNTRGYVYFAHEIRDGDDIFFVVLGPENSNRNSQPANQTDPFNGIALNEVFSYEIINAGSRIDVIIRRGDQNGPIIGHNYVDMAAENSGYNRADEWNYFKAGVYTQNNTGSPTDFDQATFYRLDNSHN